MGWNKRKKSGIKGGNSVQCLPWSELFYINSSSHCQALQKKFSPVQSGLSESGVARKMSRSSYPFFFHLFHCLGPKVWNNWRKWNIWWILRWDFCKFSFQNPKTQLWNDEKRKRNHLTLEVKHFIVQEKARKPHLLILKSINDVIFDVNINYVSLTIGSKLRRERFIGYLQSTRS